MNSFVSTLFLNFLVQLLCTVGAILIFGRLIALLNMLFYRSLGSHGRTMCYATGCIGTPIHECSHALMCIIFGHRIEEMKLFQIGDEDGTLGYVSHSYNPGNWYHRIGNFFIGTAPILIGSALLMLLMFGLLPDFFGELSSVASGLKKTDDIFETLGEMLLTSFSIFTYIGSWQWWVFFLVGGMIALHMTLSRADLRGAWSGILFIAILMLVMNLILTIVGRKAVAAVTQVTMSFMSMLIVDFCIFLIVLLILFIPVLIIRLVRR